MEYAYSLNDEAFSDFDSIQDEVNENYDIGTKVDVTKGECVPMQHNSFIDAVAIIENVQERVYDNFSEHVGDYLEDISDKKKKELQGLLTGWFNENAKQPSFYRVNVIGKETFTSEAI